MVPKYAEDVEGDADIYLDVSLVVYILITFDKSMTLCRLGIVFSTFVLEQQSFSFDTI